MRDSKLALTPPVDLHGRVADLELQLEDVDKGYLEFAKLARELGVAQQQQIEHNAKQTAINTVLWVVTTGVVGWLVICEVMR